MSKTNQGVQNIDVAALRHKFDMTQQKFADMLGISISTVQAWEQGVRTPSALAKTLLLRFEADLQNKTT